MGHGAWCITVRVSEPALVHYGAMPYAPCNKTLHGVQYERILISCWLLVKVVFANSQQPKTISHDAPLPDLALPETIPLRQVTDQQLPGQAAV